MKSKYMKLNLITVSSVFDKNINTLQHCLGLQQTYINIRTGVGSLFSSRAKLKKKLFAGRTFWLKTFEGRINSNKVLVISRKSYFRFKCDKLSNSRTLTKSIY